MWRDFLQTHTLKVDVIGPENILFAAAIRVSFSPEMLQAGTVKGLILHFIPKAVSEVPVSLYSRLKEAVTGVLDSRGFRGC